MTAIHYNVEAVEAFCSDLTARRQALEERLADERHLYETVFDGWRDQRAQAVRVRLDELTRTAHSIAADMDDLVAALRVQIRTAQEYLDGPEVY